MTSILKNPSTYLFIIILGLILYIVFRPAVSSSSQQIIADERKYDSLQVVNSHKMDSIKTFYDKKIDTLNQQVTVAKTQIAQTNQLIKSLQDAYNKEVPVINSYSVDTLSGYFSSYQQQSPNH